MAAVGLADVALTIGIVGLPNAGKSTLFNALTRNDVLAANYPFATIEPNVGVVGVPDERWGSAVAAVVSPTDPDAPPTLEDVREHLRGSLAGYKLPKHLVVVAQVERSPAGRADYRWAKAAAEAAIAPTS